MQTIVSKIKYDLLVIEFLGAINASITSANIQKVKTLYPVSETLFDKLLDIDEARKSRDQVVWKAENKRPKRKRK